ncbi:MAG: 3-hydroxyacyl-CoA dehydrogenase NAD-binding domain-containing protein [Spirochaetia bacterium]|jgi:3-hydroxybutyryl-CoA dehydrogenase
MAEGNIGVVGSGTMGAGIAQVFALAKYDVVLVDLQKEYLDHAISGVVKNLERLVAKGSISVTQKDVAIAGIQITTDYAALASCGLVVEAVSENRDVKKQVLRKIEFQVSGECIIASNTSTISITELAAHLNAPQRFVGMHFMNPAPLMQLVEVITAVQTGRQVTAEVTALAKKIGKTPVLVNDSPGFVLNRLLIPMINEAIFALDSGVADAKSIDSCMHLGANHPMGPLALADLIGLDVCLHIIEVLHTDFGDSKYRPCPLLKRMVAAGHLGRKSGRGFFVY